MTHVEAAVVERFARTLAERPAAPSACARDIEVGAERLTAAVDAVIECFSPEPGLAEMDRAERYQLVDGLVALISGGTREYAARCEEVSDRTLGTAMYDAHDAMLNDYYRMLGLRAELDEDAGATSAVISTPEELHAWFDELIRG